MIITSGLSLGRVLLYDILFSLFAFFAEPRLLPGLKKLTDPYNPESNTLIGILLLSALVIEVHGVKLKFSVIRDRFLTQGRGRPGESIMINGGMLLIILHAAIGVILAIFAFHALGFRMHENEKIFSLFFLAALFREGLIIFIIFTAKIPSVQYRHSILKNNIADLQIFFFSIIALTSTWRNITFSDKPLVTGDIAELLLFIFFSGILFLIYYMGSNMTTFFEWKIITGTSRKKFYRILSLFLVTASVLNPMFKYRTEQQEKPFFNQAEIIEKIKAEEQLLQKSSQNQREQDKAGSR